MVIRYLDSLGSSVKHCRKACRMPEPVNSKPVRGLGFGVYGVRRFGG